MATAEFLTPKIERQVQLTITESQAHRLRTILGNSVCRENDFLDIYEALIRLFPDPQPNEKGWAIRDYNGRIGT